MSFPTGDDIVSVLGYNAGLLAMLVAMALMLKPESEYSRRLLGGITALAITTYLVWRVTQTLPPFELSIGGLWPYLFMAAELMAILYSLATILILMKNRDNTALVEGALQRNRVTGNWPSVDVFICTYNEPINVLEKSILPALAMDYPNYRVFVCDDTRREHLREYCENVGANYITRPDNLHAKAGNLDNAYRRTHDAEAGELIMVLDADFAPQRHFLRRVTGLFSAPEVGLVQTPQFYYNNDPVQTAFGLSDAFVDDQRVFFDVAPARQGCGGMRLLCWHVVRGAPVHDRPARRLSHGRAVGRHVAQLQADGKGL